jgi:hypothetical protein
MKKEDLKKRMGGIPSPWDERDTIYATVPTIEEKELPEEFSLRNEQTSVKHQGEVGACTAFSACGIDEFLHKVNDLNLSERHLYCRRTNKPGPGMAPRDACKLMQKEGVCLEVCWQYISDAEKLCKGSPCENVNEQSQRYQITSYHRCFNSLKSTLFSTKSPILIVVPVYGNWGNIGSDGRVPMPSGNMISYHAMIMVGWSKKYLEVKNSWGVNFGDKGYLHIPQNYPITEGWTMEKGETNGEEKVKVQSGQIGKNNLFGVNVTFTIHSTIKSRASLFVNDMRKGFTKHIQEGINYVHFNIPFELNTETDIKLRFTTGSFFKGETIEIWKGVLKANIVITTVKNK